MKRQHAKVIWTTVLENRTFSFWVQYYYFDISTIRDHPYSFNGGKEFLSRWLAAIEGKKSLISNHDSIWRDFVGNFGYSFREAFDIPFEIENREDRGKAIAFLKVMLLAMEDMPVIKDIEE